MPFNITYFLIVNNNEKSMLMIRTSIQNNTTTRLAFVSWLSVTVLGSRILQDGARALQWVMSLLDGYTRAVL